MTSKGMNRRQFLEAGGRTAAGAVALIAGSELLGAGKAWAATMKHLDEHGAATLLRMSRQLYPHDTLGDVYYAPVVEALDGQAVADTDVARLLKDGLAALDHAKGVAWLTLSDGYQLEVLQAMEASPFFQKVRGQTVSSLYNNPLVWRHFGYEGESAAFGGYIERGFDDLGWLPDPPEAASPKAG